MFHRLILCRIKEILNCITIEVFDVNSMQMQLSLGGSNLLTFGRSKLPEMFDLSPFTDSVSYPFV